MIPDARMWFDGGEWHGVIAHGLGFITSSQQLDELIRLLTTQNDGKLFYWYPRLGRDGSLGIVGFLTPRERWDG